MLEKVKEIQEQSRRNSEKIKECKEIIRTASLKDEKRICDAAREQKLLEIENAILHDNARVALVEEVLPVIVDILKKYAGKPYGPKTKAKMSDELKAAKNCAFYINSKIYGMDRISIVPLNEQGFSGTWFNYNDFEVYCGYYSDKPKKYLLINDNRVCAHELDEFNFSVKWVDDPAGRACEITDKWADVLIAEEKFHKALDEVNNLLPSRINSKYVGRLYHDIMA